MTLPLIGAVDLGRAFKLASSTVAGREAMNAAAGAVAAKMQGDPTLEGAAGGALVGLLGEGTAGVGKLAGRTARGGARVTTLGKSSKMLRDLVSKKLPILSHGLEGKPASALRNAFARVHVKGGRSPAEQLYGDEIQKVEDNIERAMQTTTSRKASLQTRFRAMQQGKSLPGGLVTSTHEELFPVHVMTSQGWAVTRVPFKEATALMREKWPRGYRLTGAERDSATAEEWRKFQHQDSKAITAHLRTVDPQLADQWQQARNNWALAHSFADMFSDPQSFDPVTGEVNTQHLAKHMYGAAPDGVAKKPHIARLAGADYANQVHGAITHEKPSRDMPNISDIVKMPDETKGRFHLHPSPPFVSFGFHPPSGEFFPRGTGVPFSEKGRAKVPYSILRALGKHGAIQAKEDIMGKD